MKRLQISRFDSFSVREEDAIDICKQNFGIDVAWVMDPVFLCDKKVYEDLASNVKREHSCNLTEYLTKRTF